VSVWVCGVAGERRIHIFDFFVCVFLFCFCFLVRGDAGLLLFGWFYAGSSKLLVAVTLSAGFHAS
jgi:hypothetical protein